MKHSVFWQLALYGGLTLLQKGMGFILLPITTRYLSLAEYGTLELLVLTLTLASLFEISSGALPKMAAEQQSNGHKLLSSAVKLSASYGVLVAAVCWLLVISNPFDLYRLISWQQAALLALSVWLMMVLYPLQVWLRIKNKPEHYCLLVGSQTLVQSSVTLYGLSAGWGINAILIAGVVANLAAACLALALLHRDWQVAVDSKLVKDIVSYQSRLIGASLALFVLYGLDRMMISHWLGPQVLAQYGIMLKLTEVIAVCFAVFEMWWGPKRFQLAGTTAGRDSLVAVHQLVLVLLMAGLLLVSAIAAPVLRWLLPPDYLGGMTWLPAMLVVLGSRLSTSILDFGCYTQAKPVWLTRINGGYAIVAIPALLWAIPQWGVPGLLVVSAILYGSRLVVFGYLSQRLLPLDYQFNRLIALAVTSAAILLLQPLIFPLFTGLLVITWLLTAAAVLLRHRAALSFDTLTNLR